MRILCMGARVIAPRLMEEITSVWLNQPYGEGRFYDRLQIMYQMEDKYIK